MNAIKSTTTMETEFTKSEEKNGVTTRIRVVKAENGYTININTYGYRTKKGKDTDSEDLDELANSKAIKDDREYFDENKTYISEINPFAEDEKSLKEQISDAIKTIKI